MAKRAAPDEQPYRPLLDTGLILALSKPQPSEPLEAEDKPVSPKVIEMHRPEPIAKQEVPPVQAEVRRVEETPKPSLFSTSELVEKLDHEKRILYTKAETQAIDRLVTSLASRLNTQVKVSHVIRALTNLLLNAETEVDRRAGEGTTTISRPANGDVKALQRFEKEIGNILALAIKDAGPLR